MDLTEMINAGSEGGGVEPGAPGASRSAVPTPANIAGEPMTREDFAKSLLALLFAGCGPDEPIELASVVETVGDRRTPVASIPDHDRADSWLDPLTPLIERSLGRGEPVRTAVSMPNSADSVEVEAVAVPLVGRSDPGAGSTAEGLTLVVMHRASGDTGRALRSRLSLFPGLYAGQLAVRRATGYERETRRAAAAIDSALAFNATSRLRSATRALCDSLSSNLDADRVAVASIVNDEARLIGMSHTDRFVRNQDEVVRLEAVMNECADQGVSVVFPASDAEALITREASRFAAVSGAAGVMSVPLERDGGIVGVITVERSSGPFEPQEIAAVALTASLVGPRFDELTKSDRPLPVRAVAGVRAAAAAIIGPRHTWWKLAAAGLAAALAASLIIRVDDTAPGPFTVEPATQRAVTSPLDGFVSEVLVAPGDRVEAGQPLLRFSTADLRLQLAAARARYEAARTEAAAARGDGRAADADLAAARARGALADIGLFEKSIDDATVRAPIAGTVLGEPLDHLQGARLAAGRELLTIAELETLHALLRVPESRIAAVQPGQKTVLAPASSPSRTVGARVLRIEPDAAPGAGGGGSVVRIVARIDDPGAHSLRPGAEGAARITVGSASLFEKHTREIARWARLWWFRL